MSRVPASVQKGLEQALRRARSPAALNTVLELEKAMKEVREAARNVVSANNMQMRFTSKYASKEISQQNVGRFLEAYYQSHKRYHAALRKYEMYKKRFSGIVQLPERVSFNNLQGYVSRFKPVIATNVISRGIARAVNNPRTKLGQIKVLASFGTKVSTRHTPKPNVKSQKIMKRPIPKKGPKTLTAQQGNELLRTFAKLSTR